MAELVSGQWSVVSCQWSVVSGQLSVVSCQLSVVSGQLSVVSCQLSRKFLLCPVRLSATRLSARRTSHVEASAPLPLCP
ncbi:hypothetical protein LAY41_15400 [Argonema galeatum A003/A1]|nr:hypothetical protein [Argonema galeatum A003/A1]